MTQAHDPGVGSDFLQLVCRARSYLHFSTQPRQDRTKKPASLISTSAKMLSMKICAT